MFKHIPTISHFIDTIPRKHQNEREGEKSSETNKPDPKLLDNLL